MAEFAARGRGARDRSHHRRRGRRGASARHGRRAHAAARARRAGREPGAQGLDSLLSIVQMPAGVPVGTLAIGRPGAKNAALLAVAILANTRPELREKLRRFRDEQTAKVREADLPAHERRSCPARRSACSAAASSAACSPSPRGAWAIASTPFRPTTTRPTGQVADLEVRTRLRRPRRGARVRPRRRRRHLRVRERPGRRRSRRRPALAPCGPPARVLHITQHRLREKTFLSRSGLPVAPFRHVTLAGELCAPRSNELGTPGRAQDRGLRLRRQGADARSTPREDAAMALRGARRARGRPRSLRRLRARGLGGRRARTRRRVRALRRGREHAPPPHPRRLGRARARR